MHIPGAQVANIVHLAVCSWVLPSIIHKGIKMLQKRVHTPGAQVLTSVHPAVKMCTHGAECTLNFEHCTAM